MADYVVESSNESNVQSNSAMSSSVTRGGQTSRVKTFTSAKRGSLANAGSDGSSTIRGFTSVVCSGAESSTQSKGQITTALSWLTFLTWCKHLQAIGKPRSCRPQNLCHLGALTSVDPLGEWSEVVYLVRGLLGGTTFFSEVEWRRCL